MNGTLAATVDSQGGVPPTAAEPAAARLVTAGRLLRTATVYDEEWIEAGTLPDPFAMLDQIKQRRLRADVFAFSQRLPDAAVRHSLPFEMENVAAVQITSFQDWWENHVPQETRKNVRRSGRRGVTTALATFDDALVRGIKDIYDETPVRQGRRFWHYGKDLDRVRRENATYLDRCDFIGAYFEGALIGFIKIVYVDRIARIMQIVSKQAHEDKRPTNALLAKAVEVCDVRKMSHFIYGRYVYGNKTRSPMTEFKRRNGFERIDYPRYYVPLTLAGRVYVALRLYRGPAGFLPEPVIEAALAFRARLLNGRLAQGQKQVTAPQANAGE